MQRSIFNRASSMKTTRSRGRPGAGGAGLPLVVITRLHAPEADPCTPATRGGARRLHTHLSTHGRWAPPPQMVQGENYRQDRGPSVNCSVWVMGAHDLFLLFLQNVYM